MAVRVSILFLLLVWQSGFAQVSNKHCRWVSSLDEFITIDSLTIMPGSVKLTGLDSSNYSVEHNLSKGQVLLRTNQLYDSIYVCYTVLPYNFHKTVYNRSLEVYDSNALFEDPVAEDVLIEREELFATEDIQKSGSISRGITFGNNQDVFVNSTLNLNLEGKLTDDLNIRAAITDQNVPFQPEGNTQQLQDFDNVFIEVYNDNVSVKGGDVVLKNGDTYFLKYYKNVQGGVAKANYSLTGTDSASSSLGISVAKGRFASVQIPAREGLLGPYQIPGPGNEQFVLILANSEKVFLDGTQLTRGFNNDYVIDYNSAEITFTNRVLITQFSRIRVDYEYSDQDYNRTIATGNHSHSVGKFSFNVAAYSEKDNRNRPLLVDLTTEDKILLSEIGDSLQLAVTSGADSVGFSNDVVLYEQRDTVDASGDVQTIFNYSTDPEKAFYRVTFSRVGLGNGNYVLAANTANGRVFEWVSPVGGQAQGEYEPVIDIPVPDKKQMIDMQARYQINNYESIGVEAAFSDQDVNLFSELDSENNTGSAVKFAVKSNGREFSFLPKYKWTFFSDFEADDKQFKVIDRFRYIEYDRDWSFDPAVVNQPENDYIFNAGVGAELDADNQFNYQLTKRQRGDQIDGYQHQFKLNKRVSKFKLKSSAFYLDNEQATVTSTWKRLYTDLSFINPFLVPGIKYNLDQNKVTSNLSDSVVSLAMYYDERAFYIKNAPQSDMDFMVQYSIRNDKLPQQGDVQDFTHANTLQLNFGKNIGNDRLDVVFAYREVENKVEDKTEEVLSGRLDWQSVMFDNHLRSNLTYSISNSQELRREFVFVKVPAGEGTHTWRDLNDDNVQDLNEFFEAINFDERNYAKIFVPTNEFVTAFQNLFLYNITISAPRKWREAGGLKRFLSKFSNTSSWTADSKTTDNSISTRLFAFAKKVDNVDLISEQSIIRSTLFYNRTHPKYGAEFSYFDTQRKQLLVNGFESGDNQSYDGTMRYNLTKVLTLKLRGVKGTKKAGSDFLEGRNYIINSYRINPEVGWQPRSNIRLSVQYNYVDKQNSYDAEAQESAVFNEFIGEMRFNKTVKSSFNAQVRWAEIDFQGDENTPLGYDLLNALQPGRNVSWSINWQQRIFSGLQLNLTYDGRKSEDVDTIHVGRVQLSALF